MVWWRQATDAFNAAGRGIPLARWGGAAGYMILLLALLLLIPPHGILSDNEENYFALAERFVSGSAWPQYTAVFDASPHRMLSDATLGALVSAIGYSPAQVLTRLLTIAGYAVVLVALFRVFALSAVDVALVIMAMALIGQDIVGSEWLFESYEAKVVAYMLVLAGLRLVLVSERLKTASVLFAGAAYFHFLVGGFWMLAAMLLRLLGAPREVRRVAVATAVFVLLIAPLICVIAWSRFIGAPAVPAADLPTPDVIYSIIREPHHQSPFLSWEYFRSVWLPGYIMATAMLLACAWVAWRGPTPRLRVTALWLGTLLVYLLAVLVPKYLDRDTGVLGKFYLFRPSSLILLLWLMLMLACLLRMLPHRKWLLRIILLAVTVPAFVHTRGWVVAGDIVTHLAREDRKRPLTEAILRSTDPRDIVLIDSDLEMDFLDFERRVGRPTLVMWKYTPTNDAEIILWYRRMLMRDAILENGCDPARHTPPIAFVLTTAEKAARLTASCGPEIYRDGRWVLLGRSTTAPGSDPAPMRSPP